MKNLPLLLITLIGTIALVVGIAVMFSNTGTPEAVIVDAAQVMGESRPAKGAENPKATLVEFSDFECPACLQTKPLIDQLVAQYPDDVKLVYRHFPLLQIHPYAQLAAQASEAAYQEGAFWEMYDKLFETQATWAAAPNATAAKELFIGYAQELGIDKVGFTERIDSSSVRDAVNKDASYGTQIGVNATPTMFVNGQQVPASALTQVIESLVKSE